LTSHHLIEEPSVPAKALVTPKSTIGDGDVDAQSPLRKSSDKLAIAPTSENDKEIAIIRASKNDVKVTVTAALETPSDNDGDVSVIKVSSLLCSYLTVDERNVWTCWKPGLIMLWRA
jgi:hypothetical protein